MIRSRLRGNHLLNFSSASDLCCTVFLCGCSVKCLIAHCVVSLAGCWSRGADGCRDVLSAIQRAAHMTCQ